jgi:hypothetical protein
MTARSSSAKQLSSAERCPAPAGISSDDIFKLGLGFWASKALLSAVELDLFTVLATEPLDADTLRVRLGVHERGARDFFDVLVVLRMLERHDGLYRNTPGTDHYLDRNKMSYIGGLLHHANTSLYEIWGSLTNALRTGKPCSRYGTSHDPFGAAYADPEFLTSFTQAMTGASIPTANALAGSFPWSEYRHLIDVGAAEGGALVEIARAHPHLTGGGFDLPVVRSAFEAYIRRHGFVDRLRFYPGDFFNDELPSADVLLMGHILHDWDLATKRLLLAKAYAALPAGGALIVYDQMIDDERRSNASGLLMSLNMLLNTSGGFDYTGGDCLDWMRNAGFREVRLEHLRGPYSMVVATK